MDPNQATSPLSDKPISIAEKEDTLQAGSKIVKKILYSLDNAHLGSLTIAVTGEWGAKVNPLYAAEGGFYRVMSIFFRYIQWGQTLGHDNNTANFIEFLAEYLDSEDVDSNDKKRLLEGFTESCCNTSFPSGESYLDSFLKIFCKDQAQRIKLIQSIQQAIERSSEKITHADSFNEVAKQYLSQEELV